MGPRSLGCDTAMSSVKKSVRTERKLVNCDTVYGLYKSTLEIIVASRESQQCLFQWLTVFFFFLNKGLTYFKFTCFGETHLTNQIHLYIFVHSKMDRQMELQ